MCIKDRVHSSGVPACHVILMMEDDDDDIYTFLTRQTNLKEKIERIGDNLMIPIKRFGTQEETSSKALLLHYL